MEKLTGEEVGVVLETMKKSVPDFTQPMNIRYRNGDIMVRTPDGVYRRLAKKIKGSKKDRKRRRK